MIQIDMPMPDGCSECRFDTESGFCKAMPDNFCGYTKDYERPEWCPLTENVPVQPGTKPSQRGIYAYVCGVCGWNLYEIRDTVHVEGRKLIHFCPSCGRPVKWEE